MSEHAAVKFVTLEPMRVASFYAFGASPEEEAWNKLVVWAKNAGLWNKGPRHPIFGFSNPCVPNEQSHYGYELWMQVEDDIEPSGEARIEEFRGGTYAVTRCDTQGNPATAIPQAWHTLDAWVKASNIKSGFHQDLEEFVGGGTDPTNVVLDLYYPIAE